MAEMTRTDLTGDVIVSCYPRLADAWHGTRAQLCAEGVLSEDIKLPKGRDSMHWNLGGWYYSLFRCRPPGLKGPMSLWANGDWWRLRRSRIRSESFLDHQRAEIHRAEQELAHKKWLMTKEAAQVRDAAFRARTDPAFCRLMRERLGIRAY